MKTTSNHGTMWSSTLIKLVWKHCHDAWKTRNEDKHGANVASRASAKLENLRSRIRALYTRKSDCFPSVQNKWFYPDADTHFEKQPRPHQLSKWLATYEPMIITHTKRRSANQQAGQRHLIDDYFQPVGRR
jgi:hypothetical protein